MTSNECQSKLTLQNLSQQLQEWKQPYLKQVKRTAKQFQQKVKQHRKSALQTCIPPQNQKTVISKCDPNIQIKHLKNGQDKTNIQEKMNNKIAQPKFQQWKSNIQYGFKDYEDLMKNYTQVFKKKQKVKRIHKTEVIQDFRADQRQMVADIFEELKNQNQQTVSFESIQNFFQNFDLFYYFYNIHPHRLLNLLRQSGKRYDNKLTKQQFLDFFLIDRRTIAQIKVGTSKQVSGCSILSQQSWKKLKAIFDTLDTFGNQKICVKTFFQRVKNNPSNISLLSAQAIEFPQINRTYTLQKVLFDLQNKMIFDTRVDWDTIQDAIVNFIHIQQPTLDTIYLSNIQKAKIDKYSNYFLLQPEVVQLLKQIFSKCPKYCDTFVKTAFFSCQIFETGLIKPFLNCATRMQNSIKKSYLTLQQVIKRLAKDAPSYIDMDQMLELVSIKGYQNSKNSLMLYDQISNDSSEQQTAQDKQKRKLKKIKSLQQLKKVGKKKQKKKQVQEITKIKQFNLHKRQQPAIREQKVKQMILEKEKKQQQQLAKKFKANPIPVSLNPQRYQKYVKGLQKKKQSILNRLCMKRQKDQVIIDYLKSNTKLFQEKKLKNHCQKPKQNFTYQASPLPLHIAQELLPKIQAQKQQRRKKITDQTFKKYKQVYWKNIRETLSVDKDQSLLQKINLIQQRKKFQQIKAKDVPNFDQLHKKFEEELQSKKLRFQPTKIQQFKLSSPSHRKQNDSLNSPPIYRFKSISPPKNQFHHDIKSTKKYQDWVAHNHAKMAEKQLFQLQQQRQQEQRMIKQKNFAKFMRKYLSNCPDNNGLLRQKSDQKMKKYKSYIKKLESETGEQLAQIYARVLQRPFLFEQASATRKPQSKERPKKIKPQIGMPQTVQNYPFKEGIFEKEGQQFHPMESQNLNQSF